MGHIQIKVIERQFHVLPTIMSKMLVTFNSVVEILHCYHANESVLKVIHSLHDLFSGVIQDFKRNINTRT